MPTYSHLIFALSLAMLAYTGIETVSNMAEEARDPGTDVPKAVNLILIAVLGVYAGMTVVALSALPVIGHGAHATTLLGQPPPHGYQNDPVLGIIEHLGLADAARARAALLRRHPGGDDPVHRHQRRADRDLAPVVVAGRAPPAARASSPGCTRKHRTPWFTIVVFSVFAGILLIPGQTDFLGNLYSFGAMLSFTTAHAAVIALRIKEPDRERPYRTPVEHPLPRRADPDHRGDRRDRHVRRLDLGDRAARRRPLRRHRLDDRRAGRLRRLPAHARDST